MLKLLKLKLLNELKRNTGKSSVIYWKYWLDQAKLMMQRSSMMCNITKSQNLKSWKRIVSVNDLSYTTTLCSNLSNIIWKQYLDCNVIFLRRHELPNFRVFVADFRLFRASMLEEHTREQTNLFRKKNQSLDRIIWSFPEKFFREIFVLRTKMVRNPFIYNHSKHLWNR